MSSQTTSATWKWCGVTCLTMVILSLVPQFHLWLVRGSDWNGAYVSPQGDEPLYSAYINALIDGRARKNDPFGAKDSSPSEPLPESIFSIQFLPAYAVAWPARAFGVSASTAFIVLIAVAALIASLSIFWLLKTITADDRFAAAGTLFVLCLGCVVGSHGVFGTLLDIGPSAFPFLRRYQPAVAFPLFFVFQLLVWRGLTGEDKRIARVSAPIAGFTIMVLIFSHLYLWTASATWFTCVGALWLWCRPGDRRKTLIALITVGVLTAVALVPYFYLLSHRAATLDEQQILISTHRPDLLRLPEVLGAAILIVLAVGTLRGKIKRADPRVLHAAGLALLPFVVFNQQILTGRTMQVFHYEVAVVNYSTLVGLMITLSLSWKTVPRRLMIWITGLALALGVMVVGLPARLVFVPQAIANDRSVPVLLRLKELSKEDGTLADLRSKGQASTLVYSPNVTLIAWLPTWTSQGTLLDMTGVDCRGMTREERKKRFFMHLYYSKTDSEALRRALIGPPDPTRVELSGVQTAIFGYERTSPALTPLFRPIQEAEVEREVEEYQKHVDSLSRNDVVRNPLTYAVIPAEGNSDLANIDRWYERDAGQNLDGYILYRLKLRS